MRTIDVVLTVLVLGGIGWYLYVKFFRKKR
jgi:hypothetical protein